MIRQSFKPGPAAGREDRVIVSATKFVYRRPHYLTPVSFHATRLRRAWHKVPGSIGLVTGAQPLKATTYSLSIWKSEEDLRRFLRSPIHAPLMRDYKRKLRSVKSVSWAMEDFSPDKAWDEGQRRLAEPAAVDSREVTA